MVEAGKAITPSPASIEKDTLMSSSSNNQSSTPNEDVNLLSAFDALFRPVTLGAYPDPKHPFDAGTAWASGHPTQEGWTVIPGSQKKVPSIKWGIYGAGSSEHQRPALEEWEHWRRIGVNPLLLLEHIDTPSKSLCVIDIDKPHLLPQVTACLLEHGVDPDTMLHVKTGREGGGLHLYGRREAGREDEYSSRNGTPRFVDDESETGVDLKACGAYVVAPHAIHKSGREYLATLHGAPVARLEDVFEQLPVISVDLWEELKGWNLAPSRPKAHTAPRSPQEPKAHTAPRSPQEPKEPKEHLSRAGWTTEHRDATGPVYEAFLALVANTPPGTPVTTKLKVDDNAPNGFRKGTDPARHVSRREDNSVRVADFVASSIVIFHTETKEKAQVEAVEAVEAKPEVEAVYPVNLETVSAPIESPPQEIYSVKAVPASTKDGYLQVDTLTSTYSVTIYQSGLGTGKTELVSMLVKQALSEGKRVTAITPTRALTGTASRRFGLPYYEEVKGDVTDSIAVCLPSLRRVKGESDLLIIDESENCVSFTSEGPLDPLVARETYTNLLSHLRHAKQVICLDAHAGLLTRQMLIDAGRIHDTVWRTGLPSPARELVPVGSSNQHYAIVKEQLSMGLRLALAVSAKADASTFAHMIKDDFPSLNVLLVTGDAPPAIDLEDPAEAAKLDVLVYTPVIGSGVSISLRNHFHAVHLFTCSRVADTRLAEQMIHRVRHPISNTVCVSGTKHKLPSDVLLDPQQIKAYAMERRENQRKHMAHVHQVYRVTPPDVLESADARVFFELRCLVAAEHYRHGGGAVYRAIFGDVIDETQPATEEIVMIAERKRDSRAILRADFAKKAASVDPATHAMAAQDRGRDNDWAPEVKASKAQCRAFGPAFELASPVERELISYDNATGSLTKAVDRFVGVRAHYANSAGNPRPLEALRQGDTREFYTHIPSDLSNSFTVSEAYYCVVKALNPDFTNPKDITLDDAVQARLIKVGATLISSPGLCRILRLSPSQAPDAALRFSLSMLTHLGFERESTRPRWKGEKRIRVYRVKAETIARMVMLSDDAFQRLSDSYQHTPGEEALKVDRRPGAAALARSEHLAKMAEEAMPVNNHLDI
jgi:hypothetical protein